MNRRLVRLSILAGAAAAGFAVLPAAAAQAHPLGNFTVNQYAGLRVSGDAVAVDYVLDMAELPAFQTRTQQIDSDHNNTVSDAETRAYAARTCAEVAAATRLGVGEQNSPVTVDTTALRFPAGAAGLSTLRLECGLRASVHIAGEATVHYRGDAYPDRIGWREVTVQGDGVTVLRSDVPGSSATHRLTAYPQDAINTPRDVRAATVLVRPGGAAAKAVSGAGEVEATGALRGADRFTGAFTSFLARRDLSVGLGLLALLLSLVLGAAHALAPGHGKTVLAAYLVGQRGSLRHALTVAGTVAATHTAGVLVLGVLLATSVWFAPQQVYGWLAVASGALIALVGASLLRRAYAAWRRGHAHRHDPDHDHGHDPDHGHHHDDHDHGHDHGHEHSHGGGHGHHHHLGGGHGHEHETLPRLRALVAMGLAGGLSPSPSAVVVLLGAVALGRTWFGVLLVIGYGLGMAATLVGLGFALARWRTRLERRGTGRAATVLRRVVPVATSAVVVLVGVGIAAQAAYGLT